MPLSRSSPAAALFYATDCLLEVTGGRSTAGKRGFGRCRRNGSPHTAHDPAFRRAREIGPARPSRPKPSIYTELPRGQK